tara:strand:+ start:13282 stop:14142 length:861 start_codon:yes stop_codon:yes gene_type:complete
MPLYVPNGIFKDEVVDPDQISEEWLDAKRIVDNTTSWQFVNDRIKYDEVAADGAGVRVMQKQRGGYICAGLGENRDGLYIREYGKGVGGSIPWLIPYLKGYQEVWDGSMALEWTSSAPELVLIGYSMWTYRLSSQDENQANEFSDGEWIDSNWFGTKTMIRTQLGLKLDGTVIEGSGPGTNVATNNPESVISAGSQEKGIVTSSQSVHLLRAGTHRLTPVAGQGPSQRPRGQNDGNFRKANTMSYYDNNGTQHALGGDPAEENTGVAVVNCRVHAIRFPRGKLLGT